MTQTTQKPAPESVEPSDAGTQVSKRKRILIADSDGFTRMVLMLLFRMIGFAVDFTANGTIAQHKLRSHPPDALLLELKLSGLPGLELIREARREAQYKKLRIYVFTDMELMKRATRKEVLMSATKVFDKRAISREDLVKAIVIDLAETEELLRRQAAKKPDAASVPAPPAEKLQPGDLDEVIEGVSEQTELVVKAQGTQERFAGCRELLGRVCSLRSCGEAGGLRNLVRQAKALEAFLSQLCDEPRPLSQHSLNTVTQAVEVLGLLSCDEAGEGKDLRQFSAVIIDESPSSSKALTEALTDAGINPSTFGNAARALEHLELNSVDVVIANVPVPELHGLELDKIRQLSLHAATSVIFISEVTPSDPSKEPAFSIATALHRNPLLLRGIVMKALNELQRRILGPAPARTDTRPVGTPPSSQAAAAAEAADAESQALPAGASKFLSAQQRLQPEDLFVQVPAHLPIMAASEPESSDESVVPLGSQAGSWIAERTTESHDERTMLFVGNDQLAPEVNTLPSETPPSAAGGEAMAEAQIEASSSLSGNGFTEETLLEPSGEVLQASLSDSEEAAPVEAAAQTLEAMCANPTELESATNEFQGAVAPESITSSAEAHQILDEHLQALEGECAQLRESVARNENDRELLVGRILSTEGALHDAQVQLQEREQATADLQKQLDELKGQQASSEANQKQVQALENDLNCRTAEFESARSEWEKQAADHGRVESELRQQLEAAGAVNHQQEAACQQAQLRAAELEQELGALRQAHEELNARMAEEQKRAAEAADQEPESDLEQQISQGVAALARVTADLAKERGERRRSEERAAALNVRLQELHAETRRLLEAQRADQERLGELEGELRQRDEIIARRDADLEQQKAECLLAGEQLQRTRELNAQLRKDLSGFEAAHQKLNGTQKELQTRLADALTELHSSGSKPQSEPAERQRLEQALADAQRDLQTQNRKRETLETELQSTSQALHQAQSRLQQESAERQRLQEALDAADLELRNRSQRAGLETNQLQSALQFEQIERQRRETELARVRQTSLDAARGARLLRNTLRRQIREPVDNLYQSTQNLLQLELGPDQKKLAEAILQDALLVHARLQEPTVAPGEESAAPNKGASGENTVAPGPEPSPVNQPKLEVTERS